MDKSHDFEEKLAGALDGNLEAELRAGLRPIPAPEGFADRVLTRSQELIPKPEDRVLPVSILRRGFIPRVPGAPDALSSTRSFSIPRPNLRNVLRSGIAAVLLLAIVVGGYWGRRREQRLAGEHARQQVLLALRITGLTLQAVRSRVDNEHPDNKVN